MTRPAFISSIIVLFGHILTLHWRWKQNEVMSLCYFFCLPLLAMEFWPSSYGRAKRLSSCLPTRQPDNNEPLTWQRNAVLTPLALSTAKEERAISITRKRTASTMIGDCSSVLAASLAFQRLKEQLMPTSKSDWMSFSLCSGILLTTTAYGILEEKLASIGIRSCAMSDVQEHTARSSRCSTPAYGV